jgi:DNA-binding transcriptional LysR family regulator
MSRPSERNGKRLGDSHVLSGPFWGELRVFLAVAKARSFNRAAEELAMSQPTVSRQVRRLQDVMGAQLVLPTQTGIKLTRAGEELARSLLELDQKLFDISNDVTAEARSAEGLVRLAISEGLAGLFLGPAVLGFCERHPKIKLQVSTPVSLTDFKSNQADVMLGIAPSMQPNVTSRQLGYMHLIPVAAMPYIERYGVPTRSNLSSHMFVQCGYYSGNGGMFDGWQTLMENGVIAHSCDNSYSYAFMVKAGLGIGLLGSYALAIPSIVPLELGVHIRVPFYALAASERLCSKAVQIVFDQLSEVFAPTVPWFSPELRLDALPLSSITETATTLLETPGQAL